MSTKRKPRIGDTVKTYSGTQTEYMGVVDWIGSAQFSFTDESAVVTLQNGKTKTGHRVMVMFNEEYSIVQRRKVSRAEVKAKIREKKQREGESVHPRSARRSKTVRSRNQAS